MKLWKKLSAAATALAICVGITANGVTATLNTNAVDDGNDDWLHAVGSRLYDKDGNEVWLTGANWFGFNCTENCAHGLYAADVDVFLSNVADKGINIIRFPISSELLKSWMDGTPNPVNSVQAGYEPPYVDINRDFVLEDGKTMKDSMQIFDVIMGKCKKYGIKAMIDIHSPHSDNSGHNYELWYGKAGVTTDVWIDTLVWLADKYSNDDTIIGYDLKNEPHGKRGYTGDKCPSDIAKWDGSTDENNWAYAATKCANAILEVNPNALIFIEGVEQYPKTDKGYTYDTPDVWEAKGDASPWYGAWWGGNLRGVRDFPIVPDSGTSQIVYSPHDYGPSVYAQTWFDKDFTTQTLLDDYWYDTWSYIVEEDIAPLLIGEWGGHMDGDKNQKWMELLRDYMIDNHINHTFWCLNPNSGDTGGLLSYDFQTWDDEKYGLFEPSLWQTDSGKYIGLDHQRPLGVNDTGISVADFYKSGEGSNLDAGGSTDPKPPVETPTEKETTAPTEKETTKETTKATEKETTKATEKETTKATEKPTAKAVYGDADENGSVDILDVICLNRALLGMSSLSDQAILNSDVDLDEKPSPADSLSILKYIVGLIKELPVK